MAAVSECLRILRRWATEVRADVVANIVQSGRFLTLEKGLLFHIRKQQPHGMLVGIFVEPRCCTDEVMSQASPSRADLEPARNCG